MSPLSNARRPEVDWFADAMERKLRANDHKRHWRCMPLQYLSMRLTQERKELYAAIAEGDPAKVLDECADVANFAMMIADTVRITSGVPAVQQPEQTKQDAAFQAGALFAWNCLDSVAQQVADPQAQNNVREFLFRAWHRNVLPAVKAAAGVGGTDGM